MGSSSSPTPADRSQTLPHALIDSYSAITKRSSVFRFRGLPGLQKYFYNLANHIQFLAIHWHLQAR
jgi:hypothetical protein